jgi:hypothetical protein
MKSLKTCIAVSILLLLSVTANAEVIIRPLGDIYNAVQTGEVVQLVIDGVPLTGAHYNDQMETISTDLDITVIGSSDTDRVLWFSPVNGAGSVLERLK